MPPRYRNDFKAEAAKQVFTGVMIGLISIRPEIRLEPAVVFAGR